MFVRWGRRGSLSFYEIDIREKIKYLFEKRSLAKILEDKKLNNKPDLITDICDGQKYIEANKKISFLTIKI